LNTAVRECELYGITSKRYHERKESLDDAF